MDSLRNSTILAGYRIDGTLGEGGMGTVYRATQLSLERVVALKVISAELSSDPAFRERFRREGLLQATLDHPHIVTVYEAGQTEDRLFLAMQIVEGPTLKELILRHGIGDRRALRLLTQVAEALDAAHAKELIHRDVKPQNVLVGDGDHAYLADFGLTAASDDAPMTETGLFVGTIDYISPEQARGERATVRSDVYSLSAVLYECLTGQAPFVRASEERVLLAHLSEPPPRLIESRSDLPAALDEVITQGMAKTPAERPASASELILRARRALGALPAGDAGAAATRIATVRTPDVLRAAADTDTGSVRRPIETAGPANVATTQGAAATPPLLDAPIAPGAVPSRRDTRFIFVLATATVIAAAVGVWLGTMKTTSPSRFSNSASAGSIELSFPSSWRHATVSGSVPGLSLSNTIALQPRADGTDQRLLAGAIGASGPSLLSASLLAELPAGRPPEPTPVSLGSIAAYRYSGLRVRGLAAPLTIYAASTTAGVATIACLSTAGDRARECDQIAATLRLDSASSFPLVPSQAYARAISQTFASLERATEPATARLAGARSAAAQATAAEQLASAFRVAGASVGRVKASPAIETASAQLADALNSAASAYIALAGAARREDGHAYGRAGQALRGASARVAAALGELQKAGYSLSG